MKRGILYFIVGIVLTTCLSMIWAFKTMPDQPASYAAVNFYGGSDRYAVFAYSEGNPEEMKFDKGTPDPQIIVQITSKMGAKGYDLMQYVLSEKQTGSTYSFIFKKRN